MQVRKRQFKVGTKWGVDVLLPNGKRYRRIIGTKKQAEAVQRKLEAEIVEGKWGVRETEDILFSALLDEYLEYAKINKAASTFSINQYRFEAHLLPYFGDTPLSLITQRMVDSYKQSRVWAGVSPNTVNRELANLSHMLKMAVRWGYVDRNVVSAVDRMKVPKRAPRFLSQDEIGRLIEASKESHIYPIIVTALHTGMRKSELFQLRWTDINFDQRIIIVQPRGDWHTKNYKPRALRITPVLYDVLTEHKKLMAELGFGSEFVFTYLGERIKRGIRDSLRTAVTKAGMQIKGPDKVTLHILRHTFASQLVMGGAQLRAVQELMGHQSFETTLKYAHIAQDHASQQIMKLPFAER